MQIIGRSGWVTRYPSGDGETRMGMGISLMAGRGLRLSSSLRTAMKSYLIVESSRGFRTLKSIN
jgi:hypothetical protein